ncbi:VTT domain-containing protein [Chloroflexota bacterium]
MNEIAENKVNKETKLRKWLKKWEYWLGITGLVLTVIIVIVVIFFWREVRALEGYGYAGAFLISIFGGATIIAPIPMTPVIFALGTVMKPSFAPYLGPVFVGIAAGLGETIGGLAIYMTGYGGGTALTNSNHARIQRFYSRVSRWIERRGTLVLFILSATLNPFFYPAAMAAGAMRFKLKKYIIICIIGKTIKGISVAAAGYWGLGALLRTLGVPI